MIRSTAVTIAVEGQTDAAVVRRILGDHGIAVAYEYGLRGKSDIDLKLRAYNAAARYSNWFVLRDMDGDAQCPADLVAALLPRPSRKMRFRIAVRAIESWLLADAAGFSSYFSVAPHHVPEDPEALADPKAALIRVAEKSRSRAVRNDVVPAAGTTALVGPAYTTRIVEYAASSWSWSRGVQRSGSLRRCIRSVEAIR